ncbi:MAG TPA: hypothetical protein VG826_03730 [Pirellulales bacterium]|nr:hypothetical protein [Pirellulales bacterium]
MSIIRMAAIPGSVLPAQRGARTVRKPGDAARVRRPRAGRRADAFGWRTVVAEAYPAIGVTLIVGYLLWVLVLGESGLPWVGEFSPAE